VIPDSDGRPDRIGATPEACGEYDIIEELARGGMGVIYKARHRKLNRIAALKMVLNGRFSSELELRRFQVEAEAAATLDHSGIVPVYEVGEVDGRAFFAMKFVDGGSLADKIGDLVHDIRAGVQILATVSRAVHHAHQRGVLHRDLKPANILLDQDQNPLVADFGLAKHTSVESTLTNTGAIVGTPSYMSPEQAAGKSQLTTAVDVYALGAVLYELLTGEPPHRGETPMETVVQVLGGSPRPPHKLCPDVDKDLEAICLKCLEDRPDDRYVTAAAVASDLEAWLAGEPISVKPPSAMEQLTRWIQANRRVVYAGFTVITGIMFTLPFGLILVSEGDGGVKEVYSQFPSDQTPWLYSHGYLSDWVITIAMIALVFLLWPSIGILNATVVQTKSVWHALGTGIFTSAILFGIFYVLFGWIALAGLLSIQSNVPIATLAEAVWAPEGETEAETAESADNLFVGLEDIPEESRARAVADRISMDQFASAPYIFLLLGFGGVVAFVPVVLGTVLAHYLLRRGTATWLSVLRYTIVWWCVAYIIAGWFLTLPDLLAQFDNPKLVDQVVPVIQIGLAICSVLTIWPWKGRLRNTD